MKLKLPRISMEGETPEKPYIEFGEEITPSEDSVVKDINFARQFLVKVRQRLNLSLKPAISKMKITSKSTPKQSFSLKLPLNTQRLKKLIKPGVIIIFLVVLTLIGMRIVRELLQDGTGEVAVSLTPTPPLYQPYKPSIYASDKAVLKLEEEINILDGELNRANLAEKVLPVPSLDFNVSF